MEKTVVELFAGVGAFRVGFNHVVSVGLTGDADEGDFWSFVWANQFEPDSKKQDAYICYTKRFGKASCVNSPIDGVEASDIPDHSVMTIRLPTLNIGGHKSENDNWDKSFRIIKSKMPPFILIESLDRMIIAPKEKRGRNFAKIIRDLSLLGYGVEWRVINAADYGHGQKRKRLMIFCFKNTTNFYSKFNKNVISGPEKALFHCSFLNTTFKCSKKSDICTDTLFNPAWTEEKDFLDNFTFNFKNTGFCLRGFFVTQQVQSDYKGDSKKLKDCLASIHDLPQGVFDLDIDRIKSLKGAKRVKRTASSGFEYFFSEGAIPFPDDLEKPSRTILSSEGSINRMSHVIFDERFGKYRLLSSVECEMLNEFPQYWTETGMSERSRYKTMGDSMVCGIAQAIGDNLLKVIESE